MNYFIDSNNEKIEPQTSYTISGLPVTIPDNTRLLCCIAGAEWVEGKQTKNGELIPRSLKIKLHIIEPGQFKDSLKDHNLKLNDFDAKKSDKAKKHLAVYDAISGGKLRALRNKIEDSGEVSRALAGLEVSIVFGLIESTYINNQGEEVASANNWIMTVSEKPKKLRDEDAHIMQKAKTTTKTQQAPIVDDFDDSDVPF